MEFKELVGQTFKYYCVYDDKTEIIFINEKNKTFRMYHEQDCCESVSIDDINGDLDDIMNSPILLAEEVINSGENEWGTETWTFYKLSTIKGTVVIKWYGESNGYYSETVYYEWM